MRKESAAGVLLAGLLAASPASAEFIECDSCASIEAMSAAALRAGRGDHIVYSMSHELISAWAVRNGSAKASTPAAEQVEVPPLVASEFEGTAAIYEAVGGSGTASAPLDFSGTPLAAEYPDATAQDVASDYVLRRKLADYIGKEALSIAGVDPLPDAADVTIEIFDGPVLAVTVTMAGGGSVVYEVELTPSASAGMAEYKVGASRTHAGAAIVEVRDAG